MGFLMNILCKVTGCAFLTFLAACGKPDQVVEQYSVDVKVLEINPPKRYYVKFQHDGETVNKYISKRCSTYSQIKVGNVYKLTVTVKEREGKERYREYTNAREVFCPQS